MARFGADKQKSISFGMIFSLLAVLLVLGLFLIGTTILGNSQEDNQMEILQSSVERSVTQCYAQEGRYPADLSYLRKHYGLTYDENKFFIDYQFIGSNLRPDITIIKRGQTNAR